MASASLLYILYSGLQEDRLIPPKGIPKIDTFQKVFLKTGRFTTEWYRMNFDGRPSFGTTARATIPRRGHLVTRAFLVTVMPDISTVQKTASAAAPAGYTTQPVFGWTNSVGHALIQQTELTIAGEPIDTLDGRLLEMLDEFHTPLEKLTVVNRMLGRHDSGFSAVSNGHTTNQEVITPLPFWFMRGDPSAALPIDAISLDTVQISVQFAPLNSVYVSEPPRQPLTNTTFTYTNGSNSIASTLTTSSYDIVDSYILLEYVYLDKPEANRLRLANITYPIVQHYPFVYDTKGATSAKIPLSIPNLTRDLYFMAHRPEADLFNAPFLATRDLSASGSNIWWPDAQGLSTKKYGPLIPAYSTLDSEPISAISLLYEGSLVRYATDMPLLFRSVLPGLEQRKTPWHNKYYYHIPFGTQHEQFGITNTMGHANHDKIRRLELDLTFKQLRGSTQLTNVPTYTIYAWAETYALLRVYGGRAGLLFSY
jgi:hypothetical protein